jgi:hypothetical protein
MIAFAWAEKALTRTARRAKVAALLTSLSVACPGTTLADDRTSVAVRLEIANAAGAVLECQALAAHWYSFPVLRPAPGAVVSLHFTFDLRHGEVTDPGSRLPVEALYCGHVGRAWATRGAIDVQALAARAAAHHGSARVTCRAAGDAVACTAP